MVGGERQLLAALQLELGSWTNWPAVLSRVTRRSRGFNVVEAWWMEKGNGPEVKARQKEISQDPERCWNQADGSEDFRWEDGEDGWLE